MTDVSAAEPGDTAPAIASAESARGRRLATLIQGQGLIAMALLISSMQSSSDCTAIT